MNGTVLEGNWPVLGRHLQVAAWLRVWTDLGRVPRTITYARGLRSTCRCAMGGVSIRSRRAAPIAVFMCGVDRTAQPRRVDIVSTDCGSGLANATIQQRLVPVRLFCYHLMEEGLRESNPVGWGR